MRDRSILEPTFEQYKIPRNSPIKVGGVCGVATNDADYITQIFETLPSGKQKLIWNCPAYFSWYHMIKRGYSQKLKERWPTYQNVTVCEEWLLFSNFRNWWVCNNVAGWHLDKDLFVKGNLIYSPDTCVYVPNYLNNLLIDSASTRGDYPLGVTYKSDKKINSHRSQCCVGGKQKHIGYFTTARDAHRAWQLFKIKCIKEAITRYAEEANHLGVFDEHITTALEDRISILRDDADNGRETFVLH